MPLRSARLLADRVRHARLQVVKYGGRLFLLDEPENVAPTIREFLDLLIGSDNNGRKLHSGNQVHSPAPGEIVRGT